ncbi:MAG: hypothetical protein HRU15_19155, partial [Planctomycetes bacterium]|nr:hypothetical protein [Planctomycetota bacterium]
MKRIQRLVHNPYQQPSRHGSVLILCVGAVVLMASLATYFLNAVSLQREAATRIGLSHLVRMGDTSAHAEIMEKILSESAQSDIASSWFSAWRYDYLPVNINGEARFGWENSSYESDTFKTYINKPWDVENDLLLNLPTDDRVTNVFCGRDGLDKHYGATDRRYFLHLSTPDLTYTRGTTTSVQYSTESRWVPLAYYDKHLQEVSVDDDPMYILRYSAVVWANDGLLACNHNYPNDPDIAVFPDPPAYDSADPDNNKSLGLESYLNRYSRALKNFAGLQLVSSYSRQYPIAARQYFEGYDPYDLEDLAADASGHLLDASLKTIRGEWSSRQRQNTHTRTSLEGAFRGTGLGYFSSSGWDMDHMVYNKGGQMMSPVDIRQVATNNENASNTQVPAAVQAAGLSPYARGLRDQSWASLANDPHNQNGSDPENPNCPWHVNLLTVGGMPFHAMTYGMSSHLKHDIRTKGTPTIMPIADLLGDSYPEAFPLAIDAGKNVKVIGEYNEDDTKWNSNGPNMSSWRRNKSPTQRSDSLAAWSNNISYPDGKNPGSEDLFDDGSDDFFSFIPKSTGLEAINGAGLPCARDNMRDGVVTKYPRPAYRHSY